MYVISLIKKKNINLIVGLTLSRVKFNKYDFLVLEIFYMWMIDLIGLETLWTGKEFCYGIVKDGLGKIL